MLYRIDYQEVHMFEEYVEANSADDAAREFAHNLQENKYEPLEQEIVLYEIESQYDKIEVAPYEGVEGWEVNK